MKMFGTNSLSHYLFFVSRFLAIVLILLSVFIVFSLLINNVNIIDERFIITLPLIDFEIKGDYKTNTIFTMCSTLILYGGYIYLISLIFETFKADKLFTKTAVRYLRYFTILNLVGFPSIYLFIRFIIMNGERINIPIIVLHLLIGILSAFLIAVFNKAYDVQIENDLTV